MVEQRFRKPQAEGSNPPAGSPSCPVIGAVPSLRPSLRLPATWAISADSRHGWWRSRPTLDCDLEEILVELRGKRVIAIGERDGVQASAIAACMASAGAEVFLEITQCFV